MFVKKGALLAVIEDPIYIQLQQDYLTAKSRLAYLDADFIRQRDLNMTKSTSDKIYQLGIGVANKVGTDGTNGVLSPFIGGGVFWKIKFKK